MIKHMVKRSDVNERLPRFHEAMEDVKSLQERGGLEDVSGHVSLYLQGAEPVGLDETGTVILPEDYRPENGPPVLMLHPGEEYTNFGLRGTEAEVSTAYAIALQGGAKPSSIGRELFDRGKGTGTIHFGAGVSTTDITTRSGKHPKYNYRFPIPRLLTVGGNLAGSRLGLGEIMAHESDHWDFYLNEAGYLQRDPKRQYSNAEIRAIAEKRGYDTTLKIRRNLGYYANLDELSERIHHRRIRNADGIGEVVQEYTGDLAKVERELAVFSITTALGKKGVSLTKRELEAYGSFGIIKDT